tara:strand:+ start:1002 stop:2645 length:1644 start_codon:yes stop_codon:yes gene_type:complete
MKDFIKYFTGLKRNFGFCNIKNGYKDPDTGKLKFNPGDYGWSGKLITEEDYTQHLNGTKSIGIQPCDDNGLARFGAIDIDPKVYKNLDIKFYLDTIQEKKLPLIPIKSKSGGLHLYVFTEELVKAKVVKDFLEQVLFLFKLPITTEIFPKQTKLGTNTDDQKVNGNFINLPYFNKNERVALDPSGQEMTLDLFLKVVGMNLMTSTKLKDISENIVKIELTGGAEEFKDGPPCLEILSKEKMDDGRDRFLYNYMVFAKKKYADDWAKKVLQAGRNYFEFNETWTDDYIKKKIKHWEKDTKGHTCNDQLLAPVCVKSECVKRRFGVISDKKIDWPMMTNLIKVDFKPDPEYYFTVENKTGESVVVHAKNVIQLRDQKELGSLIMAQVNVLPPPIKPLDFHVMINGLLDTLDTVQPAPGTRPMEILKKHLKEYINGTQAKTYASFESGNVLKDEVYSYFVYDEFYNELKENGWRKDSSRTSHMIQKMFDTKDDLLPQPEFGKKKRFPGKHKKTGKPYPGVNGCVSIPLYLFDKEEEDVEETADFTEEEIV